MHSPLHLLTDSWAGSSFWLLRIKLPCVFAYRSLYEHVFSFLLGKYQGMNPSGHPVSGY